MKMAARQHSRFCMGCWEQMHLPVPLQGVLSTPFRAFGIRRSRMNPNTCTVCELMFTKVMRARKITIDATIMFADLRGYTLRAPFGSTTGFSTKPLEMPLWQSSIFRLKRDDNARTLAARDIQNNWRAKRESLVNAHGLTENELGIGIGIHSGELSFGEFGRSHRDLTAIGTLMGSHAKPFQLKGFETSIELHVA
jgi:adenylate cyclase